MAGRWAFLCCFRYRNYVAERRLVGWPFQLPIPRKFGLANRCLLGILSVSRSVQCANFRHAPEQRQFWIFQYIGWARFAPTGGQFSCSKNHLSHRKG